MKAICLTLLLVLLAACENPYFIRQDAAIVYPVLETTPVASADDAADDPAIWIHPVDVSRSLILGTDKQRGLAVYNLQGEQVQFLERGRLNNVDLRPGVRTENGLVTLAVATNRTDISLDIFRISDTGSVSFLMAVPLSMVDPYGVCMGLDGNGGAHVFANSREFEYEHWHLNPGNRLAPELVASWHLASGPEGCAVDDLTQTLYLGEEEYGVWMMPADGRRAGEMTVLEENAAGHLVADVEGMDVYRSDRGELYLIVSSQGDNSYAVYDLNDNHAYKGSFRIADTPDGRIDGVQETDGLSVTSRPLGTAFPRGMLVVQDGYNDLPSEHQNFKLVSWQAIAAALSL
ncbi:MAG: phytase [Pseudohongiellaceae bacterium]